MTGAASPSVVVVVPTYDERDNVAPLLSQVLERLPDAHVLVVDDNSPDGTGAVADALLEKDPAHVSVLHRAGKEGLGAAYVDGLRHVLEQWPGVDYVIHMDADLSHDPRHLPSMLAACDETDVVVGSRYMSGGGTEGWALRRRLLSRSANALARFATGLPVTDCTSGYKCFRADVLRNVGLEAIRSTGYAFLMEMSFRAWRLGYRLSDVPIVFRERRAGQSKLDFGIAFETLCLMCRLGLERLFVPRRASPPT